MSLKENFCTSPLLCAAPMEPLRTPDILVNGVAPTGSESFIYLGSAVTNANSWQTWMLRRDPNQVPFELWEKILWSCHDIKTATKIKVCNAVVLPFLLYSNGNNDTTPQVRQEADQDTTSALATNTAHQVGRGRIRCEVAQTC